MQSHGGLFRRAPHRGLPRRATTQAQSKNAPRSGGCSAHRCEAVANAEYGPRFHPSRHEKSRTMREHATSATEGKGGLCSRTQDLRRCMWRRARSCRRSRDPPRDEASEKFETPGSGDRAPIGRHRDRPCWSRTFNGTPVAMCWAWNGIPVSLLPSVLYDRPPQLLFGLYEARSLGRKDRLEGAANLLKPCPDIWSLERLMEVLAQLLKYHLGRSFRRGKCRPADCHETRNGFCCRRQSWIYSCSFA